MDIAVQNLTKVFGTLRANNAISLSFAGGQIHGVLGENGAGKSTLMKMLSGFQQRTSGEILLAGKPVKLSNPADALASGIGMVHQEPLDVPAFSSLENFYCGSPRSVFSNRLAARHALIEMADRLGFTALPDAHVGSLTVGQRQQLEIMRLLACGARVLILDEPTTGISASQKTALFAALKQLAAEGNTVLFVSHKLDEVAELCDTVSVLRAGSVVGTQMAMPQPQNALLALMFGQEVAPRTVGDHDYQQTTSDAPAAWQFKDATLRQGSLEIRSLTLDIPAGSVVGLAGLEGSGQQLLLRAMTGLLHPGSGRLLLHGQDMSRAHVSRFLQAGVQYLPADRLNDGIVGDLSLSEHFTLIDAKMGALINRHEATALAATAIGTYDIKATPDKPLVALSGGNQQRAMLSLIPDDASGILLDQPTRGLDIASARSIWGRLLARRANGTAIVFASADLDELLEYSDHVLVFFGGQISAPIPRAQLTHHRLAELIGGVGFEAMHD